MISPRVVPSAAAARSAVLNSSNVRVDERPASIDMNNPRSTFPVALAITIALINWLLVRPAAFIDDIKT